jgi:hypothetical protein
VVDLARVSAGLRHGFDRAARSRRCIDRAATNDWPTERRGSGGGGGAGLRTSVSWSNPLTVGPSDRGPGLLSRRPLNWMQFKHRLPPLYVSLGRNE